MSSDTFFSSYVGIDWSGAKGKHHAGLQVAVAEVGATVPYRVCPPKNHQWSRQQIFEYLVACADNSSGKFPVLAGIDFAFAHPFNDKGGYFPGVFNSPKSAVNLWALIDEINQNQPDLYGGGMFSHSHWGEYYLAPPTYQARHYLNRRRVTEIAAQAAGCSPSITFKAVGPDNVCTGSLAGMRLLHKLKYHLGDRLSIWPFDTILAGETNLVLVEIFPSLYFYRLGMVPAKKAAADPMFLNRALANYNSDGVSRNYTPMGKDADESDAIISAAALRYFSKGRAFDLPAAAQAIASFEGWIFGVPVIPKN